MPSADPEFETFSNLQYGVRCAAIIFRNYRQSDGLQSIQDYIARWAPSADNNPTSGYAQFVADACGCIPSDPYDVTDGGKLSDLLSAVFTFENGPGDWVSEADLAAGVAAALT